MTELPTRVVELLRAAHGAERAAWGPHRVAAFRRTRALLGGAYEAGFSIRALAGALQLTENTVRSRIEPNRTISRAELDSLPGAPLDLIDRLIARGLAGPSYLANDVISALTGDAPRPAARPAPAQQDLETDQTRA